VGIFGSKKDEAKRDAPKADFGTVRGGSPEPPRPKPKADFGNVRSGGSSTAPPAPVEAPPEPQYETYVVASGDSLSKIAKRFYGKATLWPRIHEANKDLIKNPDLIHPGWTLKIPKL
jgi:nucleoid-associated protein YgaU